nr:MAG TPA: Nuclease [Caudoviricetes sp.]
MNKGCEKAVESYFRRQVVSRGWVTWKMAPTEVGIPDRVVLIPGGAVWFVELKRARGGVISPRQRVVHSKISQGGHNVVVLAGVDEVKMWIRERESELENETDE